MKYFLLAGEASGDLHGSNLIKALKKEDPEAEFMAWGGPLMEQEGATIRKYYSELAFMGFLVVLQNLGTIFKNVQTCKRQITEYQPDAIIFIDYPGFNLRIAEWAKTQKFTTFYYISPKIWAWNQKRAWKIKEAIDKMFVIFPFEVPFYKKYDYEVEFVGHPLLDAIEQFKSESIGFDDFIAKNNLKNQPIVALLPGSRTAEITEMLPVMLETALNFPEFQFVIAGAPSQHISLYLETAKNQNISIVFGKTYELLKHSTAALVTSGTATLETALFDVPQVVCYKGNPISYHIAKRLILVKYISLVNLVLDREVVTELIQSDLNVKRTTEELKKLAFPGEYRTEMLEDYAELRKELGNSGASQRTAKIMLNYLRDLRLHP